VLVLLLIESAYFKSQFFRFFILAEFLILLQNSLKLILKNVCLDDYNALRLEDFVDLNLSLTESIKNYKLLSSAVGRPG